MVALTEVCEVILGQSPPGSSYNTDRIGAPFFQGKAEFGALFPTVSKWTTIGSKRAKPGDVLLSVRAPVGPTNLAPFDCVIGRGLAALRPRAGIETKYLLWAMRQTAVDLCKKATGSTFSAVSGSQLRQHKVLLVPLSEQRKIVEAIERYFSRLDTSEALLKSCLLRLQRLRNATLSQFADQPFAEWVPLGATAAVQGGIQKQPRRRPNYNKYAFLRVANVGRGTLNLSEVHEIELFGDEIERYRLKPNDLLVVEGNGSADQIGRSALWHGEISDCVHQNHLIRVRPSECMMPRFLELFWNAPQTVSVLSRLASSTSGLHTLSTAKVKAVRIPLLSVESQARMVERAEYELARIDKMATNASRALRHSQQLRRSILDLAFSGRLLRQKSHSGDAPFADVAVVCG